MTHRSCRLSRPAPDSRAPMSVPVKIVVVYHSGYGHTVRIAEAVARGAAAINGAIATGADRTVTVDLQKSTAGGAFSTVLSSTIGFTNASVLRTPVSGTINSPAYSALDEFRVVVSVAGSASAQATGLIVRAVFSEMPS